MSNSKIHTRSYFIKRLRDSGYTVDKLNFEYNQEDQRKWSVILDNGHSSVIITCLKDGSYRFYDGLAFVNNFVSLNTDSIEVLVTYLNSWGIINKHITYSSSGNKEVKA